MIWAVSWQNQQNSMCAQRRLRSAWVSAQSDQSLRCSHEECCGPYLPIERTAQTLIRLGRCPGWPESPLGAHAILLVLSWGGSFLAHALASKKQLYCLYSSSQYPQLPCIILHRIQYSTRVTLSFHGRHFPRDFHVTKISYALNCLEAMVRKCLWKYWRTDGRRRHGRTVSYRAVSPESSLFAHINYGSRRRVWPKTCSASGLLRMRVWRWSLQRATSAIISWVGSIM